ncbi:MAG TPA: PKD domain-containing protein [Flavobacterium sp.]|nr:PKD domain-containing protein [Flavobacterium sp.]
MSRNSKGLKQVFANFETKIITLFAILLVISIVVFSFKYRKHVDCDTSDFYIVAENFSVGEVIEFHNETPNATDWKWDFGDGSPKETTNHALHKYTEPGIYTITLVINGFCLKEKKIQIKNHGEILDRTKLPTIIAPKIAAVGQKVNFTYKYYTNETFSWEWSFGETGQIDNTNEFASYSFRTPGPKTITLIVNGEYKFKTSKIIYIKPRPAFKKDSEMMLEEGYTYEKPVESFYKPKGNPKADYSDKWLKPISTRSSERHITEFAPDISENQFELLIHQVANETKEKGDFGKYICDNYQIPVIKNGDQVISFEEFCTRIKGKEIKIESLRLTRDNLNCIDGFTISYKVKGLIGWIED